MYKFKDNYLDEEFLSILINKKNTFKEISKNIYYGKIFNDLSDHSQTKGNTIDKATFLKYFPLPGMMGERLFAVFDRDNSGNIDFTEFLTGMALIYHGTMAEKKRFLFEMYDLDGLLNC